LKTRILASATHLLASVVVVSLFLVVLYLIWYPGPLSELHGVIDAVMVLIGVDIVLGPLMTMIIFNVRKPRKELIRDLSVIVLVQIAALSWGIHTTYKVRPVFVVLYADTMYSVARNDITSESGDGDIAMPAFWQRPRQAYIPDLGEKEAVQHVTDMLTKGLPDIQNQMSRYLPVAEHKDAVLKDAMDMTAFLEKAENKLHLATFIQCHGGARDSYAFYPLEYGPFRAIVGVDREDLSLTGLLTPVM
jgi:hypothetical protein